MRPEMIKASRIRQHSVSRLSPPEAPAGRPAIDFRPRTGSGRMVPQGFTLIELCVVVALAMIATAIAIPQIMTAVRQYRIRTSTTDLSQFLERARMQAIRSDRTYAVQADSVTSGSLSYPRFYLDQNANASFDAGELVAQLPWQVTAPATNPPAPTALAAKLGFIPQPAGVNPRFNGRGTPCVVNAGNVCSSWAGGQTVGFLYYLKSNTGDWAAVSISPTGRIHAWSYAGSTWN